MKVWICVRVVEGGDPEPSVETRVALSPEKACAALRELAGEDPIALEIEPFSVAEELSGEGENLYVEEHELKTEDIALALIAAEMQQLVAKLFEPMPRLTTGGVIDMKAVVLGADEVPVLLTRPSETVGLPQGEIQRGASLLREPSARRPDLDTCTCKVGQCMAPKAAWCIDVTKRAARPGIERHAERFKQLSGGKSID